MTFKGSVGTAALTLFVAAGLVSAQGTQTSPGAKAAPRKVEQKANPEAVALQDFKKRVDQYVALHKNVAKSTPPMKQTENPAEIEAGRNALAKAIREARAAARQGDIFTPDVRAAFRQILRPEMKGKEGHDAREILKDDAPTTVKFAVNANYPETATRPTVPAALLANLPPLPPEVEYRIIGKHLLLVDTKALVIADFIPNALP